MTNINFPMLFLALLIISMFVFSGIALAYRNILLVILFFLLGNGLMGFGIYLKRKNIS